MKTLRILLMMIAVVLMFASCGTGAKLSREQRDSIAAVRADAIKTLLEARQFTVMVGSMRPMSGGSVSVSQGRKMIVKDDKVTCALPYVGTVQFANYGSTFQGLDFTSEIRNYKVEYPKKNRAKVTFEVDNGDDNYRFHVEVFMNGKTTIDVDPRGRESISYSGMFHGNEILTE